MVNPKSPCSDDATYLRKIRKPMVEKKRRDRMNQSLEQLKSLLAVNVKQCSSSSVARLDKSDILELTVSHLTTLQHQHRSVTLATTAEGYKKGFKDCARETFNYFSSTQTIDSKSLQQLNNHLQTCYLQKNQRDTASDPTIPQPADVTYAHASLGQDVEATNDYFYASSYQSGATSERHNSILQRPGVSYLYGQARSGRDYYSYSKLNDSVDTSLNSSCNMSFDSSSSITPEKIIPGQNSDKDVWRPW